jgi:hypothetical protein
MTACVFLGPTLPPGEAAAVLDAAYLPPLSQGDVLRLVRNVRPKAIGIVDGYFRAVPACWHKEILFALGEGVHVFGAASMGALRAVELETYGMVGIGRIYGALRDGWFPPFADEPFEDDDEVAVVHGPAGTGYVAVSEAMVDIRATLARAVEVGVIGAELCRDLARLAKSLFYPDRGFARLLAVGREAGLDEIPLAAFERWIAAGQVHLKREDALEMLAAMRDFLATDPAPFVAGFRLERSAAWRVAAQAGALAAPGGQRALGELVLDEVRLRGGGRWDGLRRRSVERLAAIEACEGRAVPAAPAARAAAAKRLRVERALVRAEDLERWLKERELTREGFARLAADEARLDALADLDAAAARSVALDLLRLEEGFPELRAIAVAKQDALARLAEPEIDDSSVRELVSWHAVLSERAPPPDVDAYARSLGFPDAADLARALWRERLWRQLARPGASAVDSIGDGRPGG